MVDSKFFGIPFAVSGDKATIPEDTQPSGAISYQQGYGPDYERDPETDPLAKRVPRDETNELYYQTTNAIKFLQLYGVAEWYAVDDNGDPVAYPIAAIVRHAYLGGPNALWFSTALSNTAEPGSDPTKWVNVSPGIIQSGTWNYAAGGGTANAITVTLSPVPVRVAGLTVRFKATADNSGAVTLNVNGTGAAALIGTDGAALLAGDIRTNTIVEAVWDGSAWVMTTPRAGVPATVGTRQVYSTPGSFSWVCPAGVTKVSVRVWAAGGGGGGTSTVANSASASGGGGGYTEKVVPVIPGTSYPVVVGTGGTAGAGGGSPLAGGTGGSSSFNGTLSATGGTGGLAASGAVQSSTGVGGAGSGGDLNVSGGGGGTAYSISGSAYVLPSGGFAFQTSLNQTTATAVLSAGRAGVFPGGGGGGAYLGGAGGAGAGGLVILEY